MLRPARQRFIVFCDDLSFDADDTSYKSLKTMLEGGIEGRPDNVIFYAEPRQTYLRETRLGASPSASAGCQICCGDRNTDVSIRACLPPHAPAGGARRCWRAKPEDAVGFVSAN